ncbi:aspartic peptidase A1 [Suillus spraguei]|nr:aspartic peptidase A1 [Suillus spraguei]
MMLSAASLWTLLAWSISITGSAVEVRNSRIILPMTSRLHFSNGANPVQRDDAHWQDTGVALENFHTVSCVLVGVGSPATFYRLIVDTGSANTWIGALTPYNPTDTTAVNTSMGMKITYGGNPFTGILFTDTVNLADGLTIEQMAIGVATSKTRGMAYDGILGIGPGVLTIGSIPSAPLKGLYTVTERLFKQGSISQPLVSLYFVPSTANTDNSGRLVFGEEDPGFDIGNIAYTSTTDMKPASSYWGINQRITYGSTEISTLTAGMVDCGCTFIWIASDAYDKYKTATGAHLNPWNRMLSITLEQYDALQPLNFHIGGQTYSLSRNAQIWPRSLNSKIRGTVNGIYLVVQNLNKPTGSGNDFRLGYVFLQRFYSVFNTRESRVGFATTTYTDATTN